MNVALRSDNLNIISVCTGGGGLDLGIELAMPNARPVVLVEREAFAIGHLVSAMQEGLMAPAPIWSDVTTFDGRPWRGAVDGFIGGIPCQPHSLAGRREGSDDERDLWSDARRIIVQARPWFVLIENVRGMLSAKPGLDPGALRVWRDLRRLGFSVEAGLFTAAEVGASHERERVFILAVANHADWRWSAGSFAGERDRPARPVGGRGGELADSNSVGQWGESHGSIDTGSLLAPNSAAMEHTEGQRRREGRPEPVIRSGRDSVASTDDPLGDVLRAGLHAGAFSGIHSVEESRGARDEDPERPSRAMDDSPSARGRGLSVQPRRQVEAGPDAHRPSLFPPGPDQLSRWRHTLDIAPELEPAFRRVADGLASRLDTARVDRLRMLGNGVVSLQAAYAIRTLVTRLAEGGAPGAARLVRQLWDGGMTMLAKSLPAEPASPRSPG